VPTRRLIRKHLNALIKIALGICLFGVIYWHFFKDHITSLEIQKLFTKKFEGHNIWWLLIAIALMPLNWALETQKWRRFTESVEPISFLKAYKAIFSGVLLSVFTPNRIGEYGGRILWLRPENQWKGVITTLLSSFSQILVTVIFGTFGLIYFIYYFSKSDDLLNLFLVVLLVILLVFFLFAFYNIDLLIPVAKRIPMPRRVKDLLRHLTILTQFTSKDLTVALSFAGMRFMMYSMQYFLMLNYYDVDPPLLAGLAGVFTIFLFQTGIPLPPMMGLFARGEIALFVWGHFCPDQLRILASTYSLWTLNVLLPAFMGLIILTGLNISKSLGYENN